MATISILTISILIVAFAADFNFNFNFTLTYFPIIFAVSGKPIHCRNDNDFIID